MAFPAACLLNAGSASASGSSWCAGVVPYRAEPKLMGDARQDADSIVARQPDGTLQAILSGVVGETELQQVVAPPY